MSFILYDPSFKGDESILISCDDLALNWLHRKFELNEEFLVGDGNPIVSRDDCTLVVRPSLENLKTQLRRESDNRFTWLISDASRIRYWQLIKSMLDSDHPCHQYLDSDEKASATVVISKDEY